EYDPVNEDKWYLSMVDDGYIYRATLDGTDQSRTDVFMYMSASSLSQRSAFAIPLSTASNTHKLDIKTAWDDFSFPVTFKVAQDGGNESNEAKLQEKIDYIRVDGKKLDRADWEGGKTFYVKNGSTLSYSLVQQVKTQFEITSRLCNGEDISKYSGTILMEGTAAEDRNFVINALVNNPVRFQVNCADYDKLEVMNSFNFFYLDGPTTNHTMNYQRINYDLTFKPTKGYVVSKVTVNDDKVYTPDSNGNVELNFNGMDAKYDVTVEPYTRDKEVEFYVDPASFSRVEVTVARGKANESSIILKSGTNKVMLNPADFPLYFQVSKSSIYVGDEVANPIPGEYSWINYYVESLPVDKKIRIYSSNGKASVNINPFPAGVNATITIDGNTVQPGTHNVFVGSKIEFTPSGNASDLMLTTSDVDYIDAENGKFTYTVKAAGNNLTLRPKAVITLTCQANWDKFEFTEKTTGQVYKLSGTTTTLIFPYVDGASSTTQYTLNVTDPEKVYRVRSVSSVPSGVTFANDNIVVKSGMAVTMTSESNPKPYYLSIRVIPEDVQGYVYDNETGKYTKYGDVDESSSGVRIIPKNGNSYNSANNYLRYGRNDNYRDYTQHDEYDYYYDPYVASTMHEFFNLSDDEFPLTLESRNSTMSVIVNGNIQTIWSGGSYEITKPTDSNQISILVVDGEASKVPHTFSGSTSNIYYVIDGGEPQTPPTSSSTSINIYPWNEIEIIPREGYKISSVQYGETNSTQNLRYTDVTPNEDGRYFKTAPAYLFGSSNFYSKADFKVSTGTWRFSAEADDEAAKVVIGTTTIKSTTTSVSIASLANVSIKCGTGYRVVSVVDKTSGKTINIEDGKLVGLEEGMELSVTTEQYVRDKNLTLDYFGTRTSPTFTRR
ncbi:MAG: hypothetical protein K2F70_03395, partial [Muribaculaceae bacterium]|nr:hypothetical protein [Muribaculaceae bacterium]